MKPLLLRTVVLLSFLQLAFSEIQVFVGSLEYSVALELNSSGVRSSSSFSVVGCQFRSQLVECRAGYGDSCDLSAGGVCLLVDSSRVDDSSLEFDATLSVCAYLGGGSYGEEIVLQTRGDDEDGRLHISSRTNVVRAFAGMDFERAAREFQLEITGSGHSDHSFLSHCRILELAFKGCHRDP